MRLLHPVLFQDREDGGARLAARLRGRDLRRPLVLAIPRGGVVTGARLARDLGAELDVVIARKLRAPFQIEYALGAIGEDGQVFLNPSAVTAEDLPPGYLEAEKHYQLAEIDRRKKAIRRIRPVSQWQDRSIIVTDDGIATGSTMIAALQTVRNHKPYQLIVAVPVASPDRLEQVRHWADDVVCLAAPEDFWAVSQFYEDFMPVEDEQMLQILQMATMKEKPPIQNSQPR